MLSLSTSSVDGRTPTYIYLGIKTHKHIVDKCRACSAFRMEGHDDEQEAPTARIPHGFYDKLHR